MPRALPRGQEVFLVALLIAVAGMLAAAGARADTPAGLLDPTFGSGGVSEVSGLGPAPFSDVAAYDSGPDSGKVVAVFATTQPPFSIDLARFDSNGGLDPSFGVNGVVTTSLEPGETGPFGSGKVGQVATDPSGGILLTAYDTVLGRPVLARFTETGALDDGGGQPGAGFGHCGCGFADLGAGLMGFAVTKAGEIVYTAGDTPPSGTPDSYLAFAGGLSADGEALWRRQVALGPHPTVPDDQWSDHATAVTVGPDGDLTVVGWRQPLPPPSPGQPGNYLGVVRLHSDGSPAEDFGTKGGVTLEVASHGAVAAEPLSVAIDSAQRTVVGGRVDLPSAECYGWIARVSSGGTLDGSFAGDGVTSLRTVRPDEVAIDDQDRVLAGAEVNCRDVVSTDLGVIRLGVDGNPDTSFGPVGNEDPTFSSGGIAWLGPSQYENNSAGGLALTDRGVVVAGFVDARSAVARFLTSALPDAGGVSGAVASSAGVHIDRVIWPKTYGKLLSRGVRVLLTCERNCTLSVNVRLRKRAAGLARRTVIARGEGSAGAGAADWVTAKPTRKAHKLLRLGTGKIDVPLSLTVTPIAG
jgi:uncharacterized delta-60 repeat protein